MFFYSVAFDKEVFVVDVMRNALQSQLFLYVFEVKVFVFDGGYLAIIFIEFR